MATSRFRLWSDEHYVSLPISLSDRLRDTMSKYTNMPITEHILLDAQRTLNYSYIGFCHTHFGVDRIVTKYMRLDGFDVDANDSNYLNITPKVSFRRVHRQYYKPVLTYETLGRYAAIVYPKILHMNIDNLSRVIATGNLYFYNSENEVI